MALSNWDTLALDEQGNPTNGVFVSPLGVVVSIYKNWLYVSDKTAWRNGGRFVEHTIMEIMEGDLSYLDVQIFAKRGPQNGIFCVVWSQKFSTPKPPLRLMLGCGVYGYENGDFVGVSQESVNFLKETYINMDSFISQKPEINFNNAIRFNQGDDYISKSFNQEVNATPIGEVESPILSQYLKEEGDI